jgi:hypothetical protein
MKNVFDEYPLRHSMDLVELGARSMDLVDLEFLELGCLPEKKWSGAVFVDLELRGALPNTHVSSGAVLSLKKTLGSDYNDANCIVLDRNIVGACYNYSLRFKV